MEEMEEMDDDRDCCVCAIDERDILDYLETALSCEGCKIIKCSDGQEALSILSGHPGAVHAVVVDLFVACQVDPSALQEIRSSNPGIPIFALSPALSHSDVLEAKRLGVSEVFAKPLRREDMQRIACAARAFALSFRRREAGEAGGDSLLFMGSSPSMREVRDILRAASGSSVPVLIRGETGAGKEVVAKELHRLSPRAHQPFVKLNCAALPSELVESELFGYERGAFTGAFQRKLGLFELADTGTIFLDEIGDMDVKLQAKFLQVLQDKEFKRLGGKDSIRVDVRVLAATHRDLERAISEKTFREDLYYRLNVVNIFLPALRSRGEDVVPLAELLLKKHAPPGTEPPALPPALRRALLEHSWPGNVRELENVVQRYLIFKDPEIIIRDLRTRSRTVPNTEPIPILIHQSPDPVAGLSAVNGTGGFVHTQPISPLKEVARAKDEAESRAILEALDAARWNRKRAARMLNIDYKALLYRMKKLSIEDVPSRVAVG